jgi:hypothetical protein
VTPGAWAGGLATAEREALEAGVARLNVLAASATVAVGSTVTTRAALAAADLPLTWRSRNARTRSRWTRRRRCARRAFNAARTRTSGAWTNGVGRVGGRSHHRNVLVGVRGMGRCAAGGAGEAEVARCVKKESRSRSRRQNGTTC